MFSLGTGNNIHLWTNWWHPNGVLLVRYVFQAIYDANSHLKSKLSFVIKDGHWCWKSARSQDLVEIQRKLCLVDLGVMDEPRWILLSIVTNNSSDPWEALRDKL